jgi:hypothetical protein
MVWERLGVPARRQDFYESSSVSFGIDEIEGDGFLRRVAHYLRGLDRDPELFDLEEARRRFLWIACSAGKEDPEERALRIQLADTRHSYLLHRFGLVYVVDLLNTDHWLHRPLELLANQMTDQHSEAKGKRFERRLWDYLEGSGTLRPVPQLRGQTIYRTNKSAGDPGDDLDCTFAIGNVLLLVEAKAELLRYPAETLYYKAVQSRWDETRRYLEQISDTARLLAAQRNRPNFRRGMEGIDYILPLVCRTYPEWIGSLEGTYWLREPNKPLGDFGVPRVLTPRELRNFFSVMTGQQIIDSLSHHLVNVRDVSPQ